MYLSSELQEPQTRKVTVQHFGSSRGHNSLVGADNYYRTSCQVWNKWLQVSISCIESYVIPYTNHSSSLATVN